MVHFDDCCMSANRKAERDEGDINGDINDGRNGPAPSLAKARVPVATWGDRERLFGLRWFRVSSGGILSRARGPWTCFWHALLQTSGDNF